MKSVICCFGTTKSYLDVISAAEGLCEIQACALKLFIFYPLMFCIDIKFGSSCFCAFWSLSNFILGFPRFCWLLSCKGSDFQSALQHLVFLYVFI